MPLSQEDLRWYNLPQGTEYFIAQGPNGGTASNLLSAPDGRIYKLGTGGLEGYPSYFLKRGKEFIPFFGDPNQFGPVIEPYGGSAAAVNQIGGGIVPLSTAIQYPEYRALSQADRATPQQKAQVENITPEGEAAAERAGVQTVGPQQQANQTSVVDSIVGGDQPKKSIRARATDAARKKNPNYDQLPLDQRKKLVDQELDILKGTNQQGQGQQQNLAQQVQEAISRGELAESIKQRFGLTGEQFGRLSAPDISGNYYNTPSSTGTFINKTLPGEVTNSGGPSYTPGAQTGGFTDTQNLAPVSPLAPGTQPGVIPEAPDGLQTAMDYIDKLGLDPYQTAFFKEMVASWPKGQEINWDTVTQEFNNIKSKTIDPYFQQLADTYIDSVKNAKDVAVKSNAARLEAEGLSAEQAIEQTQRDFEARGLTFSSEAIKQLGAKSAFAQPGAPEKEQSAIPTQYVPFGGTAEEGLVNVQNRLMASGSAQEYLQNLRSLERGAEQELGSTKAKELFPDISPLGGIVGKEAEQKQQALFEAAQTSIAGEQARKGYSQPIPFRFSQ